MVAEFTTKVRLVRCPKCRLLLPELPDFQVYRCGGCGTTLQAKNRLNGLRSRSRVIPPNQTVLDIVDDTNGSALNRPPLHIIGYHDYNSYGQTHQAPGHDHDDSNPIRSLSLSSIGSNDPVTDNSEPGHVDPYESSLEPGLLSFIIGTNIVQDQPHHATRDYPGHGTRVIPPNQTVLDIVDDTNGSALNRSPLHSIGSHDYNSCDQTHQAPGHDDSNPIRSLSFGIGSDDAVTNNSVPGHVDHYESSLEQGLLSFSIDTNIVTDQPHHATRVTTSVWIFSVTGFGFEAVSAFFDQVSSPQKPHYALYGMLLSIVAVLVCILDLIHNTMEQNRVASASEMLWGILPEVFGLALAFIQCISSALQFSFLCRHAENPVKISFVPFLFFFVLFAFKYRNGRN